MSLGSMREHCHAPRSSLEVASFRKRPNSERTRLLVSPEPASSSMTFFASSAVDDIVSAAPTWPGLVSVRLFPGASTSALALDTPIDTELLSTA